MKKTLHIPESMSNHELVAIVNDEINNGAKELVVYLHTDDFDEEHEYDLPHDAEFYSKHYTQLHTFAGSKVRYYQPNEAAKLFFENAKLN